jgi:hypothetical protein
MRIKKWIFLFSEIIHAVALVSMSMSMAMVYIRLLPCMAMMLIFDFMGWRLELVH